MARISESYLDAVKRYPFELVSAACEIIRDTWTNDFRAPQPGTLASTCQRLVSLRRSEIREEADRHRFERMRREQMTPATMRAALERLQSLPVPTGDRDRRVRARQIHGYQKMLGGQAPGGAVLDAASALGVG